MGTTRSRRVGLILIVLILIILIIGVAAIFLLRGVLGSAATDMPAEPTVVATAPPPVSTIDVIVAARDIPRGARLGIQDVTTVPWPELAEAPPPLEALVVTEVEGFGLEQVNGRISRVDILQGQPVLDFMLTPGDEPIGLADAGSDAALVVPSGSVMISMPITSLSTVGYALREGDHVDLLMSFDFVALDEDFQTLLPNKGRVITTDEQLIALGISGLEYVLGREESGPFGSTMLVFPSEETQRSRHATQLVIDNAVVARVGEWPIEDLHQPIIITPVPQPTAVEDETVEGQPQEPEEAPPPPTPTPSPPSMISLTMSRQDALVLKYALEQGADIDLVLRSVFDDDVQDIATDTVSLEYLLEFYNIAVPEPLGIGIENGSTAPLSLDSLPSEEEPPRDPES